MKRVLIVGANKSGGVLLKTLQATKQMTVIAIIGLENHSTAFQIARDHHIPTDTEWKNWLHKDIDLIIDANGDEALFAQLLKEKASHTLLIPASLANMVSDLFSEKETLVENLISQKENQSLLLNSIRDGMIVINTNEIVQFVNPSAEHILGISKSDLENKPIGERIKNSRLPQIIKSKQKEINQRLLLENGKTVITTRIPIIRADNKLVGAFSVFKDITEVINLAEANTDLIKIKTMLEAIIQSSDEAISVVDEHGLGIMINRAYTRITGLTEDDVIGHPAATDISEGESMHMKVLETRIPVRGVRMKVGITKKDVLVNVAPIIVEGHVKGSVGVLHDVSEIQSLTTELKKAKEIIRNLEAKYTFDDIIGISPDMTLALEQAKVGAKTPATVLLRGEPGTGKELFAHAIHNESGRKNHKFVRFNCSSFTSSKIEKELFGMEGNLSSEGDGIKSLFEEANHGSIFLDEIGELSLDMQTKLLRILQDGKVIRMGGTKSREVNVRVISATNINLEKAIMQRTFREDLFYHLNRLSIFIRPLRERHMDIPVLAEHIIDKINKEYGRNVHSITDEALTELSTYSWPGNVRELENVIGRAMIYMESSNQVMKRSHLPNLHVHTILREAHLPKVDIESVPLQQAVEEYEEEYIEWVLKQYNYNKTKTAKALHISIRNLYYKMDKYKLG